MQGKVFTGLTLMVLLMASVTATTIDLQEVQYDAYGVNIDGRYYTVTVADNVIQKIELDGKENVEYTVEASKSNLLELACEYEGMSIIQRIRFVNEKFNLPLPLMMELAGRYMLK